MTTTKRLVCLANSRKFSGRCVAGIVDDSSQRWIRPVSARWGHEVSEDERRYRDGSDPKVLDVVSVPLLRPAPHGYQSENWFLDSNFYWSKTGQAAWGKLLTLEQQPKTLWINNFSTRFGRNDRVPVEQLGTLTDSLKLIRIDGASLQVHAPGAAFDNPKRILRLQFQHAAFEYRLRVTDPECERTYLAKPDGKYHMSEAFLTISLGEPHDDGYAYKLVAAIIERTTTNSGGGR